MPPEAPSVPFRLGSLPAPAKVMVTAFVALIAAGYVVAAANIYLHHRDADLDPSGPTLNDLKRVYHGLDVAAPQGAAPGAVPPMAKMVGPGGAMRKHLEKGGEASVRALVSWIQDGAKEADFTREGVYGPGDPSVQDVIAENCVRCHNPESGEKKDAPYARGRKSPPEYGLVAKYAAPVQAPQGGGTIHLEPMSIERLVQVTHVHIISIPAFALLVGCLFFLTGQRPLVKAILGPLPMLAVCADVSSWWLARPLEPFVYVIGAAGGVFATSLYLQIACILGALWLPRAGR